MENIVHALRPKPIGGDERVSVRDISPTRSKFTPLFCQGEETFPTRAPLEARTVPPLQWGSVPPPPTVQTRPFRLKPRPGPAPRRDPRQVLSAPVRAASTLDALRSPTGTVEGGGGTEGRWRLKPDIGAASPNPGAGADEASRLGPAALRNASWGGPWLWGLALLYAGASARVSAAAARRLSAPALSRSL